MFSEATLTALANQRKREEQGEETVIHETLATGDRSVLFGPMNVVIARRLGDRHLPKKCWVSPRADEKVNTMPVRPLVLQILFRS